MVRIPAPSADAQKAASNTINEVFKKELAAARDAEQAPAIAKRLVEVAVTEHREAIRFELLVVARDLYARAGPLPDAANCVDLLDGIYVIDALEMKVSAAVTAARALSAATRPEFVALSGEFVGRAIATDRYDLARRAAEVSMAAASATSDPELVRQAAGRVRQAREAESSYAEVRRAMKALAENASDARANDVVGRHKCFVNGDWTAGLPLLARSNDAIVASAARDEVAAPKSVQGVLRVADAWWDLADKEKGTDERAIRIHAAEKYRELLSKLDGLAKIKAQKRADEMGLGDAAGQVAEHDAQSVGVAFQSGPVQLGTLNDNERYLSNRKYVVRNVPEALKNLRFTRRPGGKGSDVVLDVPAGGTVYVLVGHTPGPQQEALKASGWARVAEIPVSDAKLVTLAAFSKTFPKAERVTLKPEGFVGILVAAKELQLIQ